MAALFYNELEERGSLQSPYTDDGDIAETNDAPTGHRLPGIGVELETASILMISDNCDPDDLIAAKGKIIDGRSGKNWALTADIVSNDVLDAEYILNGKIIKLNINLAKEAAEAVVKDIVSDLSGEIGLIY